MHFWRRFKLQRLKTRAQFQAALAGGTTARTAHFALHSAAWVGSPGEPSAQASADRTPPALFSAQGVWLGAMVPKRWAKQAVTRNAIKRQIYIVAAQFESTIPLAAHVVRLRCGFDRTKFVSATSDALKLAVRLELQQLFSRVAVQRDSVLDGAP